MSKFAPAPSPDSASSIYKDIKDIGGWLLPEETTALYELAHQFGDVILEVGTFRGRSATVLVKGALSKHRPQPPQLFSLDINPKSKLVAREILGRRLSKRAVFFHGTLSEFRRQFPITPTMAFIDGDHSYEGVAADLTELSTLLPPKIPVVLHDYLNPNTPGVAAAVDEWCKNGFATKLRTFGCSVQLATTTLCTGKSQPYFEADFSAARRKDASRLSFREIAAIRMPWLVPIVRKLRGAPPGQ